MLFRSYKAHFQGKFPFSYHQIELAEYYLAYRTALEGSLAAHALLQINYEDIVRDQEAASRKLIEFVGLPWDDEVLRFHQSPAPSNPRNAPPHLRIWDPRNGNIRSLRVKRRCCAVKGSVPAGR